MVLGPDRKILGDWYDQPLPPGVEVATDVHLDSAFSFIGAEGTIVIERGAHIYTGSVFDVGPAGRVRIGECAMLNGVYVLCDAQVEIGAYATLSWNVVFMDSYRMPADPAARRRVLIDRARTRRPLLARAAPAQPVRIGDNVWIGFDVCVLPGITIGEGSVVGARSVVAEDVPPYTVVAGNPARPVRRLPPMAAAEIAEIFAR